MRLLPVPPSVSTAPKVLQVRDDVLCDQAVAQANMLVRPQAVRPDATINSCKTMSNSGKTLSGAAPRPPSRIDGSREEEGERKRSYKGRTVFWEGKIEIIWDWEREGEREGGASSK